MGKLTPEQIEERAVKATADKAAKEAKAAADKAAKEAAQLEAKGKVKVNFGVNIPFMRKAYTIEEIEADVEVQEYLLSIGSAAVTKF
jgi:hypothetical protein